MLAINPGEEGYWDVDGEGNLVIAVTDLPFPVWRKARWPLAFLPPDRVPINSVETEVYGGGFRTQYPVHIDYAPPTFLMLKESYCYRELLADLEALNLEHFAFKEPLRARWQGTRGSFGATHDVYGAFTMDQTALMSLRMLVSEA